MKLAYSTFLLVLLVTLTGCPGQLRPLSLDEKIVLAIKQVDNLYVTATQARQSGAIDDTMALRLDPLLKEAHGAAQTAAAFIGTGDVAGATKRLELADALIWKISGLLEGKE